MNLYEIRKKFFKKYPETYASFTINERLGKTVCFAFDLNENSGATQFITDDIRQKIKNFPSRSNNVFNTVISYFASNGIDQEMLDKISDYYYECILNDIVFSSIDEACDALNSHLSKDSITQNNGNHSIVTAYLVNDNGELEDRIFYMEVAMIKNSKGNSACKIENTFTEVAYYGNGLHTYGIKFLEAVLAEKGIFTIIGESIDCDLHETENGNSLNEHYKNLGFTTTTDKLGNTYISKSIEGYSSMQITADNDYIK